MKIEFRDVVKSYGGHRALDGLTLTAPSGAVYGLVGPNGAGKTTAMKHLAGVLRQDSGEVLADGAPVYENPSVKARIFCIPDEIFHFPQASILDMMRFYRGVYPGFDEKRFEQLREVFDLDVKQPMRRFSRGMLKQAAFWLAISMRPELLILDEPVDGLDPVMRRQVWALIMQDVAEYGTTVLISSHNLRELEDVCDRVGIIDRGQDAPRARALGIAGEHDETAARAPRGRVRPAGAGRAAQRRPRPAQDADNPRPHRRGHGPAGAALPHLHGRRAAHAGGDIHIRTRR